MSTLLRLCDWCVFWLSYSPGIILSSLSLPCASRWRRATLSHPAKHGARPIASTRCLPALLAPSLRLFNRDRGLGAAKTLKVLQHLQETGECTHKCQSGLPHTPPRRCSPLQWRKLSRNDWSLTVQSLHCRPRLLLRILSCPFPAGGDHRICRIHVDPNELHHPLMNIWTPVSSADQNNGYLDFSWPKMSRQVLERIGRVDLIPCGSAEEVFEDQQDSSCGYSVHQTYSFLNEMSSSVSQVLPILGKLLRKPRAGARSSRKSKPPSDDTYSTPFEEPRGTYTENLEYGRLPTDNVRRAPLNKNLPSIALQFIPLLVFKRLAIYAYSYRQSLHTACRLYHSHPRPVHPILSYQASALLSRRSMLASPRLHSTTYHQLC